LQPKLPAGEPLSLAAQLSGHQTDKPPFMTLIGLMSLSGL
jgi:hypothetical protein